MKPDAWLPPERQRWGKLGLTGWEWDKGVGLVAIPAMKSLTRLPRDVCSPTENRERT